LLFDIDHFKQVNDTYGHAAGDDVLRELASRTMNSVRSVDLVARLGGEEFVVVMPDTDSTIATAVAERLRLAVAREPFIIRVGGVKVAVTVSIGVSAAAEGGDCRAQLLKRADDALYEAKTAGRNRIVTRLADLPPIIWASLTQRNDETIGPTGARGRIDIDR
jgi:two-component system, cell cycle response regulator